MLTKGFFFFQTDIYFVLFLFFNFQIYNNSVLCEEIEKYPITT